MPKKDQFSAAESALGYLYQSRAALLLALKKTRDNPDASVNIEKFDDISFEVGEEPTELIQTKHHLKKSGNLSNASADLWKTLRIWMERARTGEISLPGAILSIVTTASTTSSSAAAFLGVDGRSTKDAVAQLEATARKSKNKSNADIYKQFLALPENERLRLIDCVYVFPKSPKILDLGAEIEVQLGLSVRDEHKQPFRERLETWWFEEVIKLLSAKRSSPIGCRELQEHVLDLIEQFKRDALPLDYVLAEPPKDYVGLDDTRVFIKQLKLIAASQKSIEYALIDYYRAFEQRGRWVREELVLTDELESYEHRLVEEWDRYVNRVKENFSAKNDQDSIKLGKRIYDWAQNDCKVYIRPNCQEPYVVRGSFHILADDQKVGWHPDFVVRLKTLLSGGATP